MNEISIIHSATFRGNTAQTGNVTNPIDNKPREFASDFYINAKGAEALKANCVISNPLDICKPVSADDYK